MMQRHTLVPVRLVRVCWCVRGGGGTFDTTQEQSSAINNDNVPARRVSATGDSVSANICLS